MEKSKKKYIIIASLLLVAIIIVSASYAYWTTTQTQTDENVVGTTCLSLILEDTVAQKTGVKLSNTYPISDEEGMSTEGYQFTITNRCSGYVEYTVNLESLILANSNANRIALSNIDAVLDDNPVKLITEYSAGTQVLANNVADDARALTSGVLAPNGESGYTVTYRLRLWLDKYAPSTQMNKSYSGKITLSGKNTSADNYPLYQVGDLNKDGDITNEDKTILNSVVSNINQATNEQKSLSDVNLDGSIDNEDVTYLNNHITSGGSSSPIAQKGDVNRDGTVNNEDAIALRSSLTSPTATTRVLGDVNLDNTLNNEDVTYLESSIAVTAILANNNSNSNLTASQYIASLYTNGDTTLVYDGTTDNNLRYVGANPNNYVDIGDTYETDIYQGETVNNYYMRFNNLEQCNTNPSYNNNCHKIHSAGDARLWRIIGVMNNIDGGTVSGDGATRIKIIKAESLDDYLYWGSDANWDESSIKTSLNSTYYNSLSETNFSNLIEPAKYYLGGYNSDDENHTYYYETMTIPTWYAAERSNYVYEGYLGSWTGNIGLIYPSDFGFATSGGSSANRTTCLNTPLNTWTSDSNCNTNNWMIFPDAYSFTITPDSSNGYNIAELDKGSYNVDSLYPDDSAPAFPTAYLKSTARISGGTGSSTQPYTFSV